ncbi:hypothetical protein KC19_2G060000 [Ceratodon purpureus]|uniref:Tudor domain-containing protein n=1 Tax=Ceratodon purpureus TaxID=3225 RepID=A0A8T0ITG6_CERPU|nr:hypothetical protein KC19_2G060000 [Ceratodon purpureus]
MPAGTGSGASTARKGDAISVFWPLDNTWYHGRIDSFDAVSGECEVLYDDGERQGLNLFTTKYKFEVKHGVRVLELIDLVRADHGNVSKQLKHIGDALLSMSDKLPSAGCCSSRQGWWRDWCADIKSAVKAGSVIALVKVTYDLACQIRLRGVDASDCRDIVSTDWWNEKEGRELWFERLRSAKTCEDLVVCVDLLKIKAVDWKKARKLFPNSDDSSESG